MAVSGYQPNDDEIAAAMAAVFAFIKEESSLQANNPIMSEWQAKALLEGCGLGKGQIHPVKQPLWKNNLIQRASLWSLLALLCICFAIPAYSKDQKIAQDSNSSPYDSSNLDNPAVPISEVQNHLIRVGLVLNTTGAEIGSPDGAIIKDIASGNTLTTLPPQSRWKLATASDTIAFAGLNEQSKISPASDQQPYINVLYTPSSNNYGFVLPFSMNPASKTDLDNTDPNSSGQPIPSNSAGFLVSSNSADGLVAVNGKLYRGAVVIVPNKLNPNTFNIINLIALEDYLLSVVPSEMPSSWPAESLKAQAIAARSYVLANLGKNGRAGFDVKATIDDQVYSGISSESESSNNAVAQTAGVVLKHDSKVIPAFFHSTSGGYTEDAGYVWGKSIPYLQAVPDYDDASPHFNWTQKFSMFDVQTILHKNNLDFGQLQNISVVSKSPALRATQVMITGDSGSKVLSASSVQRIFNLRSTSFTVIPDNDGYVFYGRGWGHGLGMSQWGAKALAEHGYNAAQILTYYYKDVSLEYF